MTSNEDIEGAKEDSARGHSIQYSVRYLDFVDRLPFGFERSFKFECNACPTSWTFRADIGVNDVALFGSVTIRRTDDGDKSVMAFFRMRLNTFHLKYIPTIKFDFRSGKQRRESHRTFQKIFQYQDRARIDEQGLLVKVSFAVRGCHINEDLKEPMTRLKVTELQRPSFALCSKM